MSFEFRFQTERERERAIMAWLSRRLRPVCLLVMVLWSAVLCAGEVSVTQMYDVVVRRGLPVRVPLLA